MSKEMIKVGVANQKERNMDVEEIKQWVPKDIHYIGTIALFKHDDTYYSMTREDFTRIFNTIKNGNS